LDNYKGENLQANVFTGTPSYNSNNYLIFKGGQTLET